MRARSVRQDGGEVQQPLELGALLGRPEARVVEVLAPPGRVDARRLELRAGVRRDPDVAPGGRDREGADPLERLLVVDLLARARRRSGSACFRDASTRPAASSPSSYPGSRRAANAEHVRSSRDERELRPRRRPSRSATCSGTARSAASRSRGRPGPPRTGRSSSCCSSSRTTRAERSRPGSSAPSASFPGSSPRRSLRRSWSAFAVTACSRRSTLVRSLGAFATALVVASGLPVELTFALAALVAGAGSLVRPIQSALLPAFARTPRELVAANVASSTGEGLGTFVGPLLAGLLVAATGSAAASLIVAAAFAAAAAAVTGIRFEHAADARGGVGADRASRFRLADAPRVSAPLSGRRGPRRRLRRPDLRARPAHHPHRRRLDRAARHGRNGCRAAERGDRPGRARRRDRRAAASEAGSTSARCARSPSPAGGSRSSSSARGPSAALALAALVRHRREQRGARHLGLHAHPARRAQRGSGDGVRSHGRAARNRAPPREACSRRRSSPCSACGGRSSSPARILPLLALVTWRPIVRGAGALRASPRSTSRSSGGTLSSPRCR